MGSESEIEKMPLVWMLAAHEPHQDPRVDWAASMAAKAFRVNVLGLSNGLKGDEPKEMINGYQIFRIQRGGSILGSLRTVAATLFFRGNSLLFKALAILLGCFGLVLLPIFILAEACVRVVVPIAKWFSNLVTIRLVKTLLTRFRFQPTFRTPEQTDKWQQFIWTVNHVITTGVNFYIYLADSEEIPAVLHCNDLDTLVGGCLYKYVHGTALVYDSHENWPYSNVLAAEYHIWFFRLLERLLIRQCDAVVTVSDPLARFLEKEYKIEEVFVVPNAEPWRGVPSEPVTQTSMSEIANGRLKFLFQGGFSPERGLEEVLDAWQRVDGNKAALFLRGHANTEAFEQLRVKALEMGLLDKSIYFLPPVDETELVAAAREADIGLIPYKPHSPAYIVACPNKLSQYMHAGLPILSSALPYVDKVLSEGNCGLTYSVERLDTFVSAVEQLLIDRDSVVSMSENALIYAENVFNWQNFGVIFIDLYKDLAQPRAI